MSEGEHRVAGRTLSGAGFMLLGAVLIQWTVAIVIPVFSVIGPSATSAWRFLLGAVVLLALTRPDARHWTRRQWLGALALGATVAFMNQCFYQAVARIPLGGAVAIEYLGPFCVAALGKRSPRHLAFVALAGAGVVALTRPGSGLTFVGVLFAAGAGLGWAAYIFASQRVGGTTKGFGGLAVSMSVAAIITLPLSLGASAKLVDHPDTLLRLSLVAVVAIALGFGAELEGLRRLKPSIAGVLMAGDPAVAFFIGWLLLNQVARGWDLVGLGCIVVAGAGVMLDSKVSESELAQ
ncbi:MAG TPA: EamA family transporter [Acidimicrobiales bacterium]|nr:EamA family transporter [Acidimicrobiales bacterium]